MLFFSKGISDFNQGFSNIFGIYDQEDDEEDERETEDGDNGETKSNGGSEWLYLIREVSDLTKERWSDVWLMVIPEFFSYVAFSRELARKEAERIRQFKMNN